MDTNIDSYAKWTEEMWISGKNTHSEEEQLAIMSFGLAGEVGEVMEMLKKRIRDGNFNKELFVKELGDVVYYWSRLCRAFDLMPSEVLQANRDKLLDRRARGVMRGSGDER